jgi:hypothetical protein
LIPTLKLKSFSVFTLAIDEFQAVGFLSGELHTPPLQAEEQGGIYQGHVLSFIHGTTILVRYLIVLFRLATFGFVCDGTVPCSVEVPDPVPV